MPGSQLTPGVLSTTLSPPVIFIDDQHYEQGADVQMDNTVRDAAVVPTTRIRPGQVLVLVAATGRYIDAIDATGDRNGVASITTAGHADGNGDIRIVGNHGSITVTTATGAGTEANNATDLNANADFAAHYTASSAAGELTIASNNVGADEFFYVHSDTMATAAFAEGESNSVFGTDADYRVTTDWADVVDENATAVNPMVATAAAGHFDASNLRDLTGEARAVLTRRGSRFG